MTVAELIEKLSNCQNKQAQVCYFEDEMGTWMPIEEVTPGIVIRNYAEEGFEVENCKDEIAEIYQIG